MSGGNNFLTGISFASFLLGGFMNSPQKPLQRGFIRPSIFLQRDFPLTYPMKVIYDFPYMAQSWKGNKMRIKEYEKQILKQSIKEHDPNAEVYLFGSRTDDDAKGGDMDILVISSSLTFQDKLKIKARIFECLEDQTIHLVISGDTTDPFVKIARNQGILL